MATIASGMGNDDHAAAAPARQIALLALLAQAGMLAGAGILLLLHPLRPELNPVIQHVGEYALGPFGALLAVAYLALGGGALALAGALARGRAFVPRTWVGVALLGLWGGGLLVAGIVPAILLRPGAPEPATRFIHGLAELVAFPSIAAALIVIGKRFRLDDRWRDWSRPALLLACAALAAYAALLVAPFAGSYPTGIPQRLFLALVLAWLYRTAGRLREVARGVVRAG